MFDLVFALFVNKANVGEPLKSAEEIIYKARTAMIHGNEILPTFQEPVQLADFGWAGGIWLGWSNQPANQLVAAPSHLSSNSQPQPANSNSKSDTCKQKAPPATPTETWRQSQGRSCALPLGSPDPDEIRQIKGKYCSALFIHVFDPGI